MKKKRAMVLFLVSAIMLNSVPMDVLADNEVEEISVSDNSIIENDEEIVNDDNNIESFIAGHISQTEALPSSYVPEDYDVITSETISNFAESDGFDYAIALTNESTAIRKQLGGTCWAEASVAMMETNLLKNGLITKEDKMSTDSVVLNLAYGFEDSLGNYSNKKIVKVP